MIADTKINYHFLLDRSPVNILPSEILEFIYVKGLLSSLDGSKISFCGLICYQGQNYFFFPRQSNIQEIKTDYSKHCFILMQALLKFTQNTKTKVESPEEGTDEIGFEKLEIFKYLINDFQYNGIFKNEEVFLQKNTGKINWKKTLSRSVSYPDSSNTPVFFDIYGNKRASIYNEITKIHAEILKEIYINYSFLFIGKDRIPYLLKQYGESTLSIEAKLTLLTKELRSHFTDRKTLLLKTIIKYLLEYRGNKDKSSIIGLTRFHVAWEHMLAQCFNNVININKYLPKPIFINKDGYAEVAKSSGMRTDIVIQYKDLKQLIVLDAKYYDATTVNNSPGWPDLVKQFFYEKALAQMPNFREYQFRNIFIFPGQNSTFDKVRMQDQKTLFFLDKEFPPIKCVYIDPLNLLDKYLYNLNYNILILCN